MRDIKTTTGTLALGIAIGLACGACGSSSADNSGTKTDSGAAGAAGDAATGPVTSDWSMYGYDLGDTRATTDNAIDATNVATLVRKWQAPLRGCTSTPAVVGGIVYTGDWFGNVRAYNASTGKAVWTTKASSNAIDDSPLVADGKVYMGDGGGDLIAVDQKTGTKLWTVTLDQTTQAHLYSSPIKVDDMLLIGVASLEVTAPPPHHFRGSVVAVDAATGAERWRVYLTDGNTTSGFGVSVWSSTAIDTTRKIAYVGSGQNYDPPASPMSDSLIAIDYTAGTVKWNRQFTKNDVFTVLGGTGPDWDVGAAPTLFSADGHDLVAVGDKGGTFTAFDRDTGDTVWGPVRLTKGSAQGGVMDAATFAEGALFVSSNNFTTTDGALDNPLTADTHDVVALEAKDGKERWRKTLPYPSVGGMAYAAGVVYQTSTDGTLHAFAAKDGTELFHDALGEKSASGASISGGMVFVAYGFQFFKTGGTGIINGGLVAYGLP